MLSILLSWIILMFIFFTFGNIVVFLWNIILKKEDRFSFFDIFWLGLVFACILLMFTSFLFSINIYINILLLAIPFIFWVLNYRKGKAIIKELCQKLCKLSLFVKIAILIAGLALLITGVKNIITYDSGLYYFQTLIWNEQYRIVPGLANLHGRFGFNSVFLLLSTLFYHPSYFDPFFPINTLCVFMIISWIIIQLPKTNNIVWQALLLLIVCIVFRFYYTAMSSLMTDILPNFIILYLILSCILEPKHLMRRGIVLCSLSCLCIMLKLSFVLLFFIPLIIFIQYLKYKQYKNAVFSALLITLLIIPWLIRFVILTGYLVYPFPSLDIFSFDWKVPIELVKLEKAVVYTCAVAPGMSIEEALNTPFNEWIFPWFENKRLLEKGTFLLALISPIIIILSFNKWKENKMLIKMWCVAMGGVIFNFINGPEPRFSYGLIVLSAFIPFFFYKIEVKKFTTIFCSIISIFFIYQSSNIVPLKHLNMLLSSYWHSPESLSEQIDREELFIYEHSIGEAIIYSPSPIEESIKNCFEVNNENRCFTYDLPCTPYPNKDLKMRGKNLQQGFKIENLQ